jgi:cyclopropane-fatty-acyl-phospholipid synthase
VFQARCFRPLSASTIAEPAQSIAPWTTAAGGRQRTACIWPSRGNRVRSADPDRSSRSGLLSRHRQQPRKLERICRKLDLKPTDRVIEIGTGWGGFALYAAQHYGCHVTTTTISREQHALASKRVADADMGAHVDLLLEDYRDLRGKYDKLVSIEMVEAIGASNLDNFFGQVGGLLRPDGSALIQAITIEDHRYAKALKSVDYIKRHVFPGSFIPSINALLASKTRASDLALTQLEDFGDSYALTLKAWRERFMAHLPEVRAQGFDDHFIRQWEFYLAYCEGGFRERAIGVAQLLLAKPRNRRAALLPEIARAEGIFA